ncbi:MAG: hypothetical protein EOP53_01220 [Sphingobacteriales bacterium]|nr:MAG: hypothetical protein EOP53_01220 [Sphingobacteriales bacterium]
MFGIVAAMLALLLVGAGMLVALILAFVLAAFISVGILSTSVLIGLHKKSFEKGFRIFWILCVNVGSIFINVPLFYFLNRIMQWFPAQTALITGIIAGVVGGFIFGIISFYIFRKLVVFLKTKLIINSV